MRTVSIFLALAFAAPVASADTKAPAAAAARVPRQQSRSTTKPTPTSTKAPATAATAVATTEPVAATVPTSEETAATAAPIAAAPATDPAAAEPAPAAPSVAPAASAAADADDDTDELVAEPLVKIPLPAKPPTATALLVEYQRVGRDLLKLQDQRGVFDCGGLMPRFKAIKLEPSLATAASRMQLYVTLAELSLKIERLRGIKLDSECLANPLAASCM